MRKNTYPGKFFAFEGIDGSGKSTQTTLLVKRLEKEGYHVKALEIPQYGKKSAGPVEEYLAGTYGTSKSVGPYRASILFAIDRYDASFQVKEWLQQGYVVVADRYVGSNMGHQGSKISSPKARKEFFKWLYALEYGIFQIPKPTISFFLNIPAKAAQKLCENPERRKKKKKDIHERDSKHFQNAERAYHHAIKLFPRDFVVIENMPKGKLLTPGEVHAAVWTNVKKYL